MPASIPARYSIPRVAGIFHRQRLQAQLDEHRRRRVVSWLSAPGGAGKTSLVASWLRARRHRALWVTLDTDHADAATFFLTLSEATAVRAAHALPRLRPEHQADTAAAAAFARQFFRALYRAMQRDCVLVLDNWHEVADAPDVTLALQVAITERPASMHIVVAGRSDPPERLARERLAGGVVVIDGSQLRLTPEESSGIASARAADVSATPGDVAALHQRADGWAAGLVLMLAQQRAGGRAPKAVCTASKAMADRELLFDYFASEVFDRAGMPEQEVLLSTAMLARVDPDLACALSGRRDAGRVLEQLARHNFFTLRRGGAAKPSYEVHALFREFLLAQGRARFSPARRRRLAATASRLLEAAGDTDASFQLLREGGADNGPALAAFVHRQAAALLTQGRTQRLLQWIGTIHAPHRNHELAYLEGMARLPHAPEQAIESFEHAFRAFRAAGKSAAAVAAWCGAVEGVVHARRPTSVAGRWIDEFATLGAEVPSSLGEALQARVNSAMFMLLMWVQPQHPQMPLWFERVRALLRQAPPSDESLERVSHQFFFYQLLWLGDVGGARETLRLLDAGAGGAALHRVAWLVSASHLHALTGRAQACVDAVEEGLRLGAEQGVHAWDLFLLAMLPVGVLYGSGDLAQADRQIARLRRAMHRGRVGDELVYHSVLAWRHVYAGTHERAEHHLRNVVALAEQAMGEHSRASFFPQLWRCGLAHVLSRRGLVGEASALMARVLERSESNFVAPVFEFMADLMRAEQGGDDAASMAALARALAFARERSMLLHLAWCPQVMASLFLRALEAGIECAHVRHSIATLCLPAPPGCRSEAWPWPVHVCVLGSFEVRVQGRTVVFATKAQKRPLALLKALVVLPASPGAGIGESRLAALFWPGADDGAALHALTTTLYRFRLLLGEGAVRRDQGRLSLDASRCWVDLWALEEALSAGEPVAAAAVARLARGELLEDDDAPWIQARRDRLLRRLGKAGAPGPSNVETDGASIRDRSVIALR